MESRLFSADAIRIAITWKHLFDTSSLKDSSSISNQNSQNSFHSAYNS